MKYLISVIVLITFSQVSFAKDTHGVNQKSRINSLSNDYHLQQALSSPLFTSLGRDIKQHVEVRSEECKKKPSQCVEYACHLLGTFGCNEMEEIKAVTVACKGNYGSACLQGACEKLSAFGCNEMVEVTQVANACAGNVDTECLEYVCNKLGTFGCNEMDEVIDVLKSCGGN